MQTGPFIAPRTYRKLFKPFHKAVNDWVHEHTTWKTFMHCCGSIVPLRIASSAAARVGVVVRAPARTPVPV